MMNVQHVTPANTNVKNREVVDSATRADLVAALQALSDLRGTTWVDPRATAGLTSDGGRAAMRTIRSFYDGDAISGCTIEKHIAFEARDIEAFQLVNEEMPHVSCAQVWDEFRVLVDELLDRNPASSLYALLPRNELLALVDVFQSDQFRGMTDEQRGDAGSEALEALDKTVCDDVASQALLKYTWQVYFYALRLASGRALRWNTAFAASELVDALCGDSFELADGFIARLRSISVDGEPRDTGSEH